MRATLFHVLVILAISMAPAAAAVDEALLDELCGVAQNPAREVAELELLYVQAFAGVASRIASKIEGDRSKTQRQLHAMANHAGRPGAEEQRAAFCRAVARQLAEPGYAKLGRRILIRSLGQIGGTESIPALLAVMNVEDLAERDLARMSLQQIPGEAADKALVEALAGATERNHRIGLIDSISTRRIGDAITALAPLLSDADTEVAAAAAAALGQIGGPASTKALGAARGKTTDKEAQRALELALLDIANQRALAGDREGAGKIFQVLGKQTQHLAVRSAAMVGVARATPKLADELIIAAIKSPNLRVRRAGVSAAVAVPSRRLATGIAAMLDSQTQNLQIQMLNALAAKGDLSVQDKVVEFLKKHEGKEEALEVAAIRCLGSLGSVKVVELLLQKANAPSAAVRNAAQESLGEIEGQDIAQTLEFHARSGKTPEIRAVAIGLFMRNRDRTGLTRIMSFAADPEPKVSAAAFAVLRKEAGDQEFRQLLDLLVAHKLAVMPVIKAVCDRSETPDILTGEIERYLRTTEVSRHQRFMMSCLDVLGSPRGLPVLIENIGDGKPASDTALKALSAWPDPIALPEMVKVLERRKDDRATVGLMAKGISRLAAIEGGVSMAKRVAYVSEAFALCPNARERLMLIQAMAHLPDKAIAEIVQSMLSDQFCATAAANTAVSLCEKLVEGDPGQARSLAIAVTKGPFHSILRARAQAILKQLDGGNEKSF